jgi:hypothetical protein
MIWYRNYVDVLISSENRVLYVLILSVLEKFTILKQLLASMTDNHVSAGSDNNNVSALDSKHMPSFTFLELGDVLRIVILKYNWHVYQLNLTKYLQNLLVQMRAFELANTYVMVLANITTLGLQLENICGEPYEIYPVSSPNVVFMVFIRDFQRVSYLDDTLLSAWLGNLPVADFVEIA